MHLQQATDLMVVAETVMKRNQNETDAVDVRLR